MLKPVVTIVTPVYNEELGLDHYEETVTRVLLARPDIDFRILFVDDGSLDSSWRKITAICARSPAFSGIRLSRNFGVHSALSAGIDHAHAHSDAVVILACDLQDPAEVTLEFVAHWRQGAQIVWGVRRNRPEGRLRIITTELFVALVRRYALPKGSKFTTGSFLLMDRTVVDAFCQLREHNRVTFALVAWTGFEQSEVLYDRQSRMTGVSGWTAGRTLHAIYDVFVGFSEVPARMMTLIGILTFITSLFMIIYLVGRWVTHNVLPGWTGLMVMMTAMFGLMFMMIGTICEYTYRIFLECTNRPLYFVSSRTGSPPRPPSLSPD